MDLSYEKRRTAHCEIVIQKDFFATDDWLGELRELFANGTVIKKGNTAKVVRVTHNNQQVLIKKYKVKNLWHSLRHSGRTNRAKKSWQSAFKLQKCGIPTPTPLGYVSEYKYGLFGGAYLITEYIENQYLHKYFTTLQDKEQLQKTAKLTQNIFDVLQKNYIVHGDCKCMNILVHNHKPILIDLDSIKFYGYLGFQRRKNKDRKRFRHELHRFPHLQEFFGEML